VGCYAIFDPVWNIKEYVTQNSPACSLAAVIE